MVVKPMTPIFINVPYTVRTPNRKVEIDGTDVSDDVISISVVPGMNNQVSSATILLNNNNGKYTADFAKGDMVKVYMDYGSATKKIFEGPFYTPTYITRANGNLFELHCKGYGYDAIKKKVNYESGTSDTISNLFKYLITNYLVNNYGHSADFSNIATITTEYTPSWSRRTVLECMQDLIVATNNEYDFYCDDDKKWYLYEKGTKVSTESAVYGNNIIYMRLIDGDLLKLNNRLSLYGETIDSIPRLKTDDDLTSQTQYGIFEDDIDDNNITTHTQMANKLTSELSIQTSLEQSGICTIVGAPDLLPGYYIYVMNPYCNCIGLRRVIEVTHNFTSSGFKTTMVIEEKERGTVYFIQKQVKEKTSKVPWGMENSYIMKYLTENYGDDTQTPDANAEINTMTQTVVWENRLMLELNTNSGNAVMNEIITTENISQYVVSISGSNLEGDDGSKWVTVDVNLGNGWKRVNKDTIITPAFSSKNVNIRINMVSLTTKIKSVAFLWK